MKVVQISTWNVICGIAGYTKGLVNGMSEIGTICDTIAIDRIQLQYMTRSEIKEYFRAYMEKLSEYDVIHIQHEFCFFAGSYGMDTSIDIFHSFLTSVVSLKKQVFVTFHTEPIFFDERTSGIRGLINKNKLKFQWKTKIASLFNSRSNIKAIVHTKSSRRAFIDSGFSSSIVSIIKQGVTFSPRPQIINENNTYKEKLGFSSNSIILSMFGFICNYKGYITALKALRYLPTEYHLVIIGKPNPESSDNAFDSILRLLKRYTYLDGRVTLTGFLEYEELQSYYGAVDLCLAPYEASTQLSSSAAVTWALSSGKPVIASQIAAFQELNREANCLHLFTPGCSGELAYQIQKLANDDNLKEVLVTNALKYCEFNQWARIAKNHLEMYTSCLHSSH